MIVRNVRTPKGSFATSASVTVTIMFDGSITVMLTESLAVNEP